jgi:hypothetical protein
MRVVVILLSIVAIGIAGAAIVLPLGYGFVYVGYIGGWVAGVVAIYGAFELIRVVTGRLFWLAPPASAVILLVGSCVAGLYLHDELLPTSGHSLDVRLMTKGRLIISDSPSPAPRKSP